MTLSQQESWYKGDNNGIPIEKMVKSWQYKLVGMQTSTATMENSVEIP